MTAFLTVVLILLVYAVFSVAVSYASVETSRNELTLKGITDEAVIVLISDLHGREVGRGNSKLISAVKAAGPDAVCLTGDFIDVGDNERDIDEFCSLVSALCGIAPVYYSYGNHEMRRIANGGDDFSDKISAAGAKLLECSYTDVNINGQTVRIGGMYGSGFVTENEPEGSDEARRYCFLTEFTACEYPTLLLSHCPDSFVIGSEEADWEIGLILSGHVHGGLWRLPIVGGLVSHSEGLFPVHDKGMFALGRSHMVITSGLAGSGWIPRLGNPGEITVITLKPENTK